jgi:hypothetical protein
MRKVILFLFLLSIPVFSQSSLLLLYQNKKAAAGGGGGGSLPTDQLYANWDFADVSKITFRDGTTNQVLSVKSLVGISPDMDLRSTTATSYGNIYDPIYNPGDKSITFPALASDSHGFWAGTVYGLLTTPFTIILVNLNPDTNNTTDWVFQLNPSCTGLRYDAPQKKYLTVYGSYSSPWHDLTWCTKAVIQNAKTLVYYDRDVDGNCSIFINNQLGLGTSVASMGVYPYQFTFGQSNQISVPISGAKAYQLIIYNKILSTAERTQLLNYLNSKWNIW